MYMHVYTSICTYVIYCYTYWVDICMYMHVYDGICMYMTYMYVSCSYMHVFSGMTPSDTGTDATSLKNTLRGWQSAGHTQGTPGHLGFHFIQQLAKVVHTLFGAPHPAARVLGP